MSRKNKNDEDELNMNGEVTTAGRHKIFSLTPMSDSTFMKFSKLIYNESGIKLDEKKKIMLASRLSKRLRALGISNFKDYYEYLCNPGSEDNEIHKMIDVVSTNKTEFFRESPHFELLSGKVLPDIVNSPDFKYNNTIQIWSAGCSSGEEAYTIAIICNEFMERTGCQFSILATDISTRIVEAAKNAIYRNDIIESVPLILRRKYFMRGKGENEGYHRVIPELRRKVDVKKHNLVYDDFSLFPMMDVIFCRNVVIYFDRNTQITLYEKLIERLNPGGYLFIGHSETLTSVKKAVDRVAPTVYRKLE